MISRYVRNEKGNTLLVIIGLLVGAIFISFIFFDFFTTYASKRVSQTSADAAVLAAANEIKDVYDEKLKSEIEIRMDRLREVANEFVQEKIDEIMDDNTEEDEDGNPIPPPSLTARELDTIWKWAMDKMQIPNELRKAVRYSYEEVNANLALRYFFKNVWYKEWFSREVKEINDVACEAIKKSEPRWTDAATYFAVKNGAEEDIDIIFKGKEFKVMARVKKSASFITVKDQSFGSGEQDVFAEAEASIKTPKEIDIKCK
ncbi:pilus assembly protein TadG-related protein [Lederbergia panacisoli]|uniref:pilus assembly protein TadG-related protein n=1 Tax=Lederbergia panacisoli TaxID=1255251 RepID=UPI00214B4EEB|nr:pilus assembly protein TadG-related protein [Lederbergia panacisoli]MCR2823704.1 pilus assembly protein TadG-related protein [Lederbergia panacisoli]